MLNLANSGRISDTRLSEVNFHPIVCQMRSKLERYVYKIRVGFRRDFKEHELVGEPQIFAL